MGREDKARLTLAIILSILLTITLFYLTLELPYFLDGFLKNYYPDIFFEFKLREEVLNSLRPIGYLALLATLILILLGFMLRRSYLSIIGSLAIYVPVFGYFAAAMFFLAGIGVLRLLWLPLIEYSPETLMLGNIVLVPCMVIMVIFRNGDVAMLLALIFIFMGLFIFSLGVATWLYGRFRGDRIIDFWIYRYVRHPQYLGYIIWSYGLLVYTSFKPYVRGALATPPSYPWLISTFIIVGVALYEEIEMRRRYKEDYMNYVKRSSFMIPLPGQLIKLIKLPLKMRGGEIEKPIDIIIILATYLIILTILTIISFYLIILIQYPWLIYNSIRSYLQRLLELLQAFKRV